MLCIGLETFKQVLFALAGKNSTNRMTLTFAAIFTHLVQLGLWFWILSLIPLGIAFPLMSLSFVTIAVAGKIFFKEKLGIRRWAATLLVAIGTSLIWGH